MDVALRARIYCGGLLGFVAVVVHGNDLWTSSSAVLMGTCVKAGRKVGHSRRLKTGPLEG